MKNISLNVDETDDGGDQVSVIEYMSMQEIFSQKMTLIGNFV